MVNINLLPWREEERKIRERETWMLCGLMIAVACIVGFLGKSYMDSTIEYQGERNAYMQKEIASLSKIIGEIETLKQKRDELLTRMNVIQKLQVNRSQIVHMFDDLVNKLPKGVYYNSLIKANNKLHIEGKAQSNGRVSALMRGLDASDWFDDASLKVVDVVDQDGVSVSEFQLDVVEQAANKKDEEI